MNINEKAVSIKFLNSQPYIKPVRHKKGGRPPTDATHLANFNEKVHKPQSKLYGRISVNMQLFLHISYEFEYLY